MKKYYGLDIVSFNDESGIPFGMREGIIITSTYPIMEATIFKMAIKNNVYCLDDHFSISNDAILRNSSCAENLLLFLTNLATQYFAVDYNDIMITDDLLKCLLSLNEGNVYDRKNYIKKLKILDKEKKD